MAYQKPYLTVSEQIALIQSRGMVITDRAKAEHALERIGYYRLSGFWYPFRLPVRDEANVVKISGNFRPLTNLETVIDLYVFDKKLRLLFGDALERIEIALRVQISLLLGKIGPTAHRDPKKLHGNFSKIAPKTGEPKHHTWLKRTDQAFSDSREEFATHFREKYAGEHPPIWIACELWDFGALSTLFGGLQKPDQTQIADQYGINSFKMMESWIRTLNVTRNICAHHGRLWNRPLVFQPSWPTPDQAPKLAHIDGVTKSQTRTYAVACISKHMLDVINPTSSWGERLKTLCSTFPDHPVISLEAAGFPPDWQTQQLWN
jgi:abortive infection bacteriophage resistance protein